MRVLVWVLSACVDIAGVHAWHLELNAFKEHLNRRLHSHCLITAHSFNLNYETSAESAWYCLSMVQHTQAYTATVLHQSWIVRTEGHHVSMSHTGQLMCCCWQALLRKLLNTRARIRAMHCNHVSMRARTSSLPESCAGEGEGGGLHPKKSETPPT